MTVQPRVPLGQVSGRLLLLLSFLSHGCRGNGEFTFRCLLPSSEELARGDRLQTGTFWRACCRGCPLDPLIKQLLPACRSHWADNHLGQDY